MNLDYAHASRIVKLRRMPREHDDDAPRRPARDLGRGWRTRYPEDFPVIVTRLDPVDDEDTGDDAA